MKSVKYWLKTVISFGLIVVLLASIVPVAYLMRDQSYNRSNISGFYGERDNSLDMVYIGGSACFVFWEPLRAWNSAGFTSYNFAHDTMSPQAVKHFVIEAQKTQTPKLWVIDLRPFQYGDEDGRYMYSDQSICNSTDHLSYSANRDQLVRESVAFGKGRFNYYFDLSKYHDEWLVRAFGLLSDMIKGKDSTIQYLDNQVSNPTKGFYFVPKAAEVVFHDYSAIHKVTKIDADCDYYFTDLLNYCRSNNLQVLFVVNCYCQTETQKEEYNYMAEKIQEFGFDYLNANDYYQEIGLDYSFDMYNEDHVNVFGADKFTDFLTNYILAHYDLPDRRQDAEYSAWNEDYVQFSKRVAAVKEEIIDSGACPKSQQEG